mgnify:CR=1 FL=1
MVDVYLLESSLDLGEISSEVVLADETLVLVRPEKVESGGQFPFPT